VHALARAGAQVRNLERAHGLFVVGVLDYYMGRYADARNYGEVCLAVAREIGNELKVADALALLGAACYGQGDRDNARRYLMEGLALARTLGDDQRLVQSLSGLAEFLSSEGKLDEAEPLYREILDIDRALGDLDGVTATLMNLARVALAAGAGQRAATMLREALSIGASTGSDREGHQLLAIGATLAATMTDWERAARFFGAAEAKLLERGFQREPADAAFLEPWIERVREAMPAPGFAHAETAGRALAHDTALAELRTWVSGIP
jgi:tetratricopeptide (TPR) repeat protein